MHNLEKSFNRRKPVLFFKKSRKALFFGKEVVKMNERGTEIRSGTIRRPDGNEAEVKIIDLGENYDHEEGSIPNHDKVEIVYISPKS
jgi:hypothetical protein